MPVHFGEFSLDPRQRELIRNGKIVHLTPKAFRLLELLLEQRPNVIPKEQLYSDLWPGTFVEETNLSNLISEVRAALGDNRRRARFIRTVHGFGYGFVGQGFEQERNASRFHLSCGSREFELQDGETIIGRDTDVAVRIDTPGISRHHVRIVVAGDRVFLEDLGSKNGTFVRHQRVEGRVEVHDGDEIRLARELLVFHARRRVASTVTQKPFVEP